MMHRLLLSPIVALCVSVPAMADQILVPDDFSSIQDAINAANSGDEVVIAPGTYEENITINKDITVRSQNPSDESVVANTVLGITEQREQPIVRITKGELAGLTIQGSKPTRTWSTVLVASGTARIRKNVIKDHSVAPFIYDGSVGIIAASGQVVIEGNRIEHNVCFCEVGGLSAVDQVIVNDNEFLDNANPDGYGAVYATDDAQILGNKLIENLGNSGGGIVSTGRVRVEWNHVGHNDSDSWCGGVMASGDTLVANNLIMHNYGETGAGGICAGGNARVINNTIVDNEAGQTDGGGASLGSSAAFLNNIVAFNTTEFAPGGGIVGSGAVSDFNCVYGNVVGFGNPIPSDYGLDAQPGPHDINVDPLLQFDRLHLTYESPCVDAGTSDGIQPRAVDYDGQPRMAGITADIGADEIVPFLQPDYDQDGDVDINDFGFLQACMGGANVLIQPACVAMDLDGDLDVDQSDFGVFQRELGP